MAPEGDNEAEVQAAEDQDDQPFDTSDTDPEVQGKAPASVDENVSDKSDDDDATETDPIEDFYASVDDEIDFSEDDEDESDQRQAESKQKKPEKKAQSTDDKTEADPAKKADAAEGEVEADKDKDKGAESKAKEDGDKKPDATAETPQAQKPEQTEPLTAEQIAEQQRQHRQQAEDLMSKHYTFTDEEYEQYEENPREMLPKLAARLYMDAVTNSMAHVIQLFPQMLETTLQARDNNKTYEEQFFGTWPKLREHEADVRKHAMLYRQAFPNATPEEVINNVGAQVMIAKKIAPDPVQPQQPNGAPARQATPRQPHKPAAAAPPARAAQQPDNFFEELSREDENEQYG